MKFNRIIALAAAAAIAATGSSGCSKKKKSSDSAGDIAAVTDISGNTVTTAPAETFPSFPITYPEIEKKRIGDLYEAEDAKLSNGLSVEGKKPEEESATAPSEKKPEDNKTEDNSEETEGFSGTGYVTGFKPDGSSFVTFEVDAPSNQHYDLSFSIASERLVDCRIALNGTEISTFKTKKDGEFTLITLYGVFLVKGSSEIEVRPTNGNIKLDYLKLANNTSLSTIRYEAREEPVNKEAGESAKELMSFLTEKYGRYTLTGQYASSEENSEIDLVYQTTGKYPAVRLSAMHTTGSSFDSTFKDIDACAAWYYRGGIVGLMWYWDAPSKKPSVYAKDTDFKLSDAVTDRDISQLSQEEIRELYAKGKISEQCYGLILDIDNMAGQLMSLKNKGVPVLWRPLHEAGGDWFWWGASGPEAYKWLWELMYKRYTDYFELDNLIWVWNGQSKDYLVEKSTFDIASLDIYMDPEKDYGSRCEQFLALQKIVGKEKIIALSECSTVPDIDASFRDNSVWSFFGLWYGKYLCGSDGELSGKYTTKDALIRAYNSEGALTLDEYIEMTGGRNIPAETAVSTTAPSTSAPATSTAEDTDVNEASTETTAVETTVITTA